MLLFIVNKTTPKVNWWLRATGCKNPVTRNQLKEWYAKAKRGVEGVNPTTWAGIIGDSLATLGIVVGSSQNNKQLQGASIFVLIPSIIATLGGGKYTYDLISEIKSKILPGKKEEKSEDKNEKPPQITERIIERTIIREPAPTGDTAQLEELQRQVEELKRLLEGREREAAGETTEETTGETDDGLLPDEVMSGEGATTTESITNEHEENLKSIIKDLTKILNIINDSPYSRDNIDHLKKLTRKGTETLSIEDLKTVYKKGNTLIKLWALTCLLNKEDTEEVDTQLIAMCRQFKNKGMLPSIVLLGHQYGFPWALRASTNNPEKIKNRSIEIYQKFKQSIQE